jgi:hypothetical protein
MARRPRKMPLHSRTPTMHRASHHRRKISRTRKEAMRKKISMEKKRLRLDPSREPRPERLTEIAARLEQSVSRATPEDIAELKAHIVLAVSEGISLSLAARAMAVPFKTLRAWQDQDQSFVDDLGDAFHAATGLLEGAAFTRALNGSDDLVKFLLTHRDPARYSGRATGTLSAPASEVIAMLQHVGQVVDAKRALSDPQDYAVIDADYVPSIDNARVEGADRES